MITSSRSSIFVASLIGAGFAACQSSGAPAATSPKTEEVRASAVPMELSTGQASAWAYLAGKYDANRDGRVTADEYHRDNFARLDRNGDGVLTEADYANNEDRMQARMQAMRAQFAVINYFQADGDVLTLKRDELEWSVGDFDIDDDGEVSQTEFEALAPERHLQIPAEFGMSRMMSGASDPWTALVAEVDQDSNGSLALAELEAFFDKRDDGDREWVLESPSRPIEAVAEQSQPESGPHVGTVAPDFELSSPDGGESVTLSAFAGSKPVALIFGSYT